MLCDSYANRGITARRAWHKRLPVSHTNFSWNKTDLRRKTLYFNVPPGRAEREEAVIAATSRKLRPLDFIVDDGHFNTASGKLKKKGRKLHNEAIAGDKYWSGYSFSDHVFEKKYGKPIDLSNDTTIGSGRLLTLLPMVYWYDSMHVALTDYYNNFVFETDVRVANDVSQGLTYDPLVTLHWEWLWLLFR